MSRAQRSDQTRSRSLDRHDKESHSFLNPTEWDFRSIEDDELLTALIFEYTRSSPPTLAAIQEWHSQPFETAVFAQPVPQDESGSLRQAIQRIPNITNAQIVNLLEAVS